MKVPSDRSIIVMDDDPTGCQTLHGIPVLFNWNLEILIKEFEEATPLFFLMTNSRSLNESQAVALYRQTGLLIREASKKTGRKFSIISRSDSTLRGHYPAEPKALHFLYPATPVHCLIPAFFQGGRVTIGDEHYVKTGNELIPASETPFAQDKVFGFLSSNLKQWVEEKTSKEVSHQEVYSFSLEDLRTSGPEHVKTELLKQKPGAVVVVNAEMQSDLDIFATGALMAENEGAELIYRSAASFLNSYGRIKPLDPLKSEALRSHSPNGGLFIVGSYVPKSTTQLKILLAQEGIQPVELEVERILTDQGRDYMNETVQILEAMIAKGRHVVLYTSRKLVHSSDPDENLDIGRKVSEALVFICREIRSIPAFIVAKGGITSHDVASKGLEIQRARVLGPALPGVPVLVPENRPDLRYIVFPGNVGENDALSVLYHKLKQ
jgi:uncharacterized protein YgbK (DUF1537 family)